MDGKSIFYKRYFDKHVKYTSDLLYNMPNIEFFKVVRSAGLTKSNFLVWSGLRKSLKTTGQVAQF